MVTILHVSALTLYLASAGLLAGSLAEGRWRAHGGWIAASGIVLHGLALASYLFSFGELPLVGLAPSLSVLAFLIGIFLLGATVFGEARTLSLVLVPLMAVLLGGAVALGIRPTGEAAAYRGIWLFFHTLLTFGGYAGLAVAFAAGLVYLLQFREIKGKRLGRVFRFFPSLAALDVLGWWSLAIGFPALTAGLLVGWAWSARFHYSVALMTPKVLWGILTWGAIAAALVTRAGGGRNRRSAMISVVGFIVVVVTYLSMRLTETGGGFFP